MTDPSDDDALRRAGGLAARRHPAQPIDDPRASGGRAPGGAVATVALSVLGGIAVLETSLWIWSAFQLQIAASVSAGAGSPVEILAFVLNLAGRVLAVLAPVVWFAIIAWRVRVPSNRLAFLVLGAVLLLPWPAILAAR